MIPASVITLDSQGVLAAVIALSTSLLVGIYLGHLWEIRRLFHAPPAPVPPAPAPSRDGKEGADAEICALLAAAAAAYLKAPIRILSIRFPVAANTPWAHEGREEIMLSHRIR